MAAGVVSQQRWVALGLVALLGAGAGFRLVEWYTGASAEDWRGCGRARSAPSSAQAKRLSSCRSGSVSPRRTTRARGSPSIAPRGHRVWLLLAVSDAERRLELARDLVRPPRYALLDERRYGDELWLQIWDEP